MINEWNNNNVSVKWQVSHPVNRSSKGFQGMNPMVTDDAPPAGVDNRELVFFAVGVHMKKKTRTNHVCDEIRAAITHEGERNADDGKNH